MDSNDITWYINCSIIFVSLVVVLYAVFFVKDKEDKVKIIRKMIMVLLMIEMMIVVLGVYKIVLMLFDVK